MTEVPQDEVELRVLKTELGSVTQSDVEAAALAEASIFAFNVGAVPPDVKVREERKACFVCFMGTVLILLYTMLFLCSRLCRMLSYLGLSGTTRVAACYLFQPFG